MPDSQVDVPIGLDIAPAQQSFKELIANATTAGKKMGDSLGVGITANEKRLHHNFDRLFESIASGGNVVESVFDGIGNSIKLALPLGVALIAVKTLYEAISTGIEVADKFGKSYKNALTLGSEDLGSKSVEELQANVEQLKKDEADTNLAAMTNLQAGATVFVQALEEGKNLSQVILEDAQQHLAIQQELAHEQDLASAKKYKDEADIQEFRNLGLEDEAQRAKTREKLEKDLIDAQGSAGRPDLIAKIPKGRGNKPAYEPPPEWLPKAAKPETIAQIQRLITDLDAGLEKKHQDKRNEQSTKDFDQNLKDEQEARDIQAKTVEDSLTGKQKELELTAKIKRETTDRSSTSPDSRGSIDKALATDKAALQKIQKDNNDKAWDKHMEEVKSFRADLDTQKDLEKQKKVEQTKVSDAETKRGLGIDRGIEVSSLRKVGLGGRVGVATKDPQVEAIKEGNNTLKLLQQKLDAVQSKLEHLGAV